MSFLPRVCALMLLLFALPVAGFAQFGNIGSGNFKYPAEVSASFDPPVAFIGETVRLNVTVDVDEGHYLYSLDPLVDPEAFGPVPTSITVEENEFLVASGEGWNEPRPEVKEDAGFETMIRSHEGKVIFWREFEVQDVADGDYRVSGGIMKQICDDTSCLPPRTSPFEAVLVVRNLDGGEASAAAETPATGEPEAGGPADEPAATEPEPAEEEEEEPAPREIIVPDAETEADAAAALTEPSEATPEPVATGSTEDSVSEEGLIGIMVIGFIGGLLSLLTPCVFPMIPITISFFTKRASKTRGERIRLCFVYAGSIVFGFALLGFGLSLALRFLGLGAGLVNQFAANPWLNLFIAGVFIAFALSLFGMFDLALPTSWSNKLQKKQGGRTDAIGAFFMAMIFVVVSFTCTAPIAGTLIVATFQGMWLKPFFGMLGYGVGFALPFFVLGLVPGMIASLPKSGSWLNATKVTMGFVEIAAAMKFISNADLVWDWDVFTREVVLASWAAVALIAALYLIGLFRTAHDHGDQTVGPVRLCWGLAFGTVSLYFAFGLFAGQLHPSMESFLPPTTLPRSSPVAVQTAPGSGGTAVASGPVFIKNDLERAKRLSREQNKPLFIDFTGETCTNCRLNEIRVFPDPEVAPLLGEYIVAQLYTDEMKRDESGRRIGEKYQEYQSETFGTITLPFYVTMTPEGDQVATYGGLIRDKAEFRQFLSMALDRQAAG